MLFLRMAIGGTILMLAYRQARGYRTDAALDATPRQRAQRLEWIEVPVHNRCRTGHSRISATPVGIMRAGYDMLSTILLLALKPA